MIGGVSPETRWASYKYEIKFWCPVASCWIFCMNYVIATSLTATSSATNPTCTVCEIQPRRPQCWTGDSPHELWHCLNYCSPGRTAVLQLFDTSFGVENYFFLNSLFLTSVLILKLVKLAIQYCISDVRLLHSKWNSLICCDSVWRHASRAGPFAVVVGGGGKRINMA
jgi:hypothetical protein